MSTYPSVKRPISSANFALMLFPLCFLCDVSVLFDLAWVCVCVLMYDWIVTNFNLFTTFKNWSLIVGHSSIQWLLRSRFYKAWITVCAIYIVSTKYSYIIILPVQKSTLEIEFEAEIMRWQPLLSVDTYITYFNFILYSVLHFEVSKRRSCKIN